MARKSEALERWRVKLQNSVTAAQRDLNAAIVVRDKAQREVDIAQNTVTVKQDLLDDMNADEESAPDEAEPSAK
jgi:hypothetical protein